MLELNSPISLLADILPAFHHSKDIFCFVISTFDMSLSVPSLLSTTLPRYGKESSFASPTVLAYRLIWLLGFVLTTLVFLVLIIPVSDAIFSNSVNFSCICCWLWDSKLMLSTKFKSSSWSNNVHCMSFFLLVIVLRIIQSTTREKSKGYSKQSCLTPVVISNGSWMIYFSCLYRWNCVFQILHNASELP